MKKWTYLVAACMLAGATPVITGCVDTDEPAGIEQLRGAKAELLKAQAQVELTRIEYVKAQAQYELARANKMQAEADWYTAQAEWQNAKNEQDKLMWAEDLREKKAAVDAAIAESNAAKASQELAYINSMKAIAIAKASLTKEEYKKLWLQTKAIAVAQAEYDLLNGELADAENDLSAAMNWLTDSQDNHEWQSQLEHAVRVAQYKYEAAVDTWEKAKANADLTNTDIPALQARVDDLDAYQDSVEKAGDELALEKAEWYAQYEEDQKIAENELEEAKNKEVELEAFSLTVDMSALNISENPTYEYEAVSESYTDYYDENAADDEWLKSNSDIAAYVTGLENDIEELNALRLDENGIAWTTVSVNNAKAEKEKLQKNFETENDAWEAAIKALNEGKGVKADELVEYHKLDSLLTVYNAAVTAYNAAVTVETTATGVLTQAGITISEATEDNIESWQEIVDDENSTKAESEAAQKKIDAANAYLEAVEGKNEAKDALVGTPATATAEATKGAYQLAKDAFDTFVESILRNADGSEDRWVVVENAYGDPDGSAWAPKTITAEQLAEVTAVTEENVRDIIEAESEKLFGESFGSRLVTVTLDELKAQVKKDIEELELGTEISPVADVIEWDYSISKEDVTDYQIEYFFLGGFKYTDPSSSVEEETTYGKIGNILQAASNETRGNAFVSGNAKAVDDAIACLQGYLDKAIGAEGLLTLNNAAVAEKQDAYDKLVADIDAEFEKTELGQEISRNKALQTMYENLISKLVDTIESFLEMHTDDSQFTDSDIMHDHDWAALQDALDMLVNIAYDDMERAEDALLRAQKNQEEFLNEPQAYVEECTQIRDEAQQAFDEASAKLQEALQDLQDAIDEILASVQGL